MITQDRITQLQQQCQACLDSSWGDSVLSLKASELAELCEMALDGLEREDGGWSGGWNELAEPAALESLKAHYYRMVAEYSKERSGE